MRKVRGILLVLLVVGMLAAGCSSSKSKTSTTDASKSNSSDTSSSSSKSGGSATSPTEWVNTFCSALNTWKQTLSHQPNTGSDLATAKQSLLDYLTGVDNATTDMINQVKNAGTPDVDHGSAIAASMVSKLQDVEKVFADAKDKTQGLSTDDATAFQSDATSLASDLDSAGTAAGEAIGTVATQFPQGGQALSNAAKNASACKALGL